MTVSVQKLTAIRRLSQYRPFERGGASALEAKEDLILAALAEADGSCESIGECTGTIEALWGLKFEPLEIAQAVNDLLTANLIERESDGSLHLSPSERERLEAHAELSRSNARLALEDWHAALTRRYPSLTGRELEQLDQELQQFLTRIIHRHGAEATLLMFPNDPAAQQLYQELEDEGFNFLGRAEGRAKERRDWALSQFVRQPTDAQKAFLSAVLNCAFYTTVLSIDPEAARVVKEAVSGQRVYLDTNFIYRLLGVQGPRYVRPAETILRATQAAGYVCAVTPWTIAEFRTSLTRSQKFLELYPLPPDQFAALAAEATSDEDFVTSYWRQARTTRVSVEDYVAYHREVESHLAARGIALVSDGVTAVEQRQDEINQEISILENVLHGKDRHPELLAHDVKHRLLVRRLRGDNQRTFATAGFWFMTHDTVLPRYDYKATGRDGSLPFCVSVSSWFQVVEAFLPKTQDMEQTLADILASPYIRPRRTISKQAAQAVVARVALYKDGTPELAARVFMNSAAMHEIERSSPEEQAEKVEKAIITAAKQAQEEAKEAQATAAEERERATQAVAEAAARVREAEERREAEVARTQALGVEAVKNEEARAAQAVQAEQARGGEALANERARHRAELEAKQRDRDAVAARAAKLRRRLVLIISVVVATTVFMIVGLFAGIDAAWAYLVGVGVLIGLAAGIDQLFARRSE